MAHPPQYTASLGPAGKHLAVFDQAQQARNRAAKYEGNKEETLDVYSITMSRSHIEPISFRVDLLKHLASEELLSYGFSQSNLAQGDRTIYLFVQAKNLKTYVVNYEKDVVK